MTTPTTYFRTISVAMQKGGVGKTTTAITLADALRRQGYRVLLIDLDPQANATKLLRQQDQAPYTASDLLLQDEPSIEQVWQPTKLPEVWMVGANLKLATCEQKLRVSFEQYSQPLQRLQARLNTEREIVNQRFDLVILDCPPTLGLLALNALMASDYVLIPVESGSQFSFEGLDDLSDAIRVCVKHQPHLSVLGYVLTMHDARQNVCKAVQMAMAQKYGDAVLKTTIANSTIVRKAEFAKQTVIQFDRKATAANDYLEMGRECLERMKLPPRRGNGPAVQS